MKKVINIKAFKHKLIPKTKFQIWNQFFIEHYDNNKFDLITD